VTFRVTRKTARLLRVLLNVHADRKYAAKAGATFHMSSRSMMEEARISVSSFYVLMDRLEQNGWVEGEWGVVPAGVTRPRPRYYHLTEQGVTWARAALQHRERPTIWNRLMRR
jgi:hypothetical protein